MKNEKLIISINMARRLLDTNYAGIYFLIANKQIIAINIMGKKKILFQSIIEFLKRNEYQVESGNEDQAEEIKKMIREPDNG